MKADPTSAQWDYSVEVANLLRQPRLGRQWKDLLSQVYGPDKQNRPPFSWDPLRSRRLHQKLQCQDFRPGIRYLLVSAYILGLPNANATVINGGQYSQLTLDTPVKDIRLEGLSDEELDTIFMRHQNSSPQTPYQYSECAQLSISSMGVGTPLQHHLPDQTAYMQPSASFNTNGILISRMNPPIATTFNIDPNSSVNVTPFPIFIINSPVDDNAEDGIFPGLPQQTPSTADSTTGPTGRRGD